MRKLRRLRKFGDVDRVVLFSMLNFEIALSPFLVSVISSHHLCVSCLGNITRLTVNVDIFAQPNFHTSNHLCGKQSLWATSVMVQVTYEPLPSRYGPLQLWSSTYNGHIVNELGVHIGV